MFFHSSGIIFLFTFLEVVALLANPPIMSDRSIWMFTHLEHQNLSIVQDFVERGRMGEQFQNITEKLKGAQLYQLILDKVSYIELSSCQVRADWCLSLLLLLLPSTPFHPSFLSPSFCSFPPFPTPPFSPLSPFSNNYGIVCIVICIICPPPRLKAKLRQGKALAQGGWVQGINLREGQRHLNF